MQNLWITGLILASVIGSGAAVGYGAMNGLGGMHSGMHAYMHGTSNVNCNHHDDCDYTHEDCEEYHADDCDYEHQECYQESGHMGRGC